MNCIPHLWLSAIATERAVSFIFSSDMRSFHFPMFRRMCLTAINDLLKLHRYWLGKNATGEVETERSTARQSGGRERKEGGGCKKRFIHRYSCRSTSETFLINTATPLRCSYLILNVRVEDSHLFPYRQTNSCCNVCFKCEPISRDFTSLEDRFVMTTVHASKMGTYQFSCKIRCKKQKRIVWFKCVASCKLQVHFTLFISSIIKESFHCAS